MSSEEFLDNRNFLLSLDGESISEESFEKFKRKYGEEVAKGYVMALVDMQVQLRDAHCKYVDNHWTGEDHFILNSYFVMTKRCGELLNHITQLLEIGSAVSGYPSPSYLDGVKVPRQRPDI